MSDEEEDEDDERGVEVKTGGSEDSIQVLRVSSKERKDGEHDILERQRYRWHGRRGKGRKGGES